MADDLFERGLAVRKDVIGADYVNKALAEADEFTRPHELKIHIRGAKEVLAERPSGK